MIQEYYNQMELYAFTNSSDIQIKNLGTHKQQ